MDGSSKLAAFLKARGLTQLAFATMAGVPGPQVSLYLSRRRRPGLAAALKIEKATAGEVPAGSWVSSKPPIGPRRSSPRTVHATTVPR